MMRPLLLAAALLAPAAAFAQAPPDAPASTATPPAVGADAAGRGRYGAGSPEMRQARQAMMQACSADFARFCGDTPAGGGGRVQCLRAHVSDLSEGCRGSMQAMRSARGGGPPRAGSPPG